MDPSFSYSIIFRVFSFLYLTLQTTATLKSLVGSNLTRTKILSMLGTGYFLKTAKINSQRERPMCPIVAKISFSETEKNPNRKNKLPQ